MYSRRWLNLRSDLAWLSDSELARRLEEAWRVLDASSVGGRPMRYPNGAAR